MKTKAKQQKSLGKRLVISCIWFALIAIIAVTMFVAPYKYYTEMKECSEIAYAYARTAAELIDGDKALDYLQSTGVDQEGRPIYDTDSYYDMILSYLDSAQDEYFLMKYYYVFVPHEDDIAYIWDAENVEGACQLGDHEQYMTGGKEAVEKAFRTDPIEELTVFDDPTYGYIVSAYYPIYDHTGTPVAVVGVDLSMERIISTVIHNVLFINIFIVLITLIVVALGFTTIHRKLVQPIGKLNTATKSMVENIDRDQDVQLDIHTHDELEELAASFLKMNSDLREYLKKLESVTAEKERIGAELQIAAQIQTDMLPRDFSAFSERREFDLYASMDPAKEVGGDFYDFFLIDDNHLALVIADVSGKGVPAALFMANAKTLIKNRTQEGGGPSQILDYVNEKLCEGNKQQYFVTVWLAIIDLSTGKGLAANAGHEHPALRRAGGEFELVLYRHSPGVAMFEGMSFMEHSFALRPGDTLFVYTDGVPEATDSDNVLFDNGGMLKALNKDPGADPKTLLQTVRAEIDAFIGDAPQFDDITMLALRYNGAENTDELTLDAKGENFDTVIDFVDGYLNRFDCSPVNKNKVRIAVEELFVNVASYAYAPGTGTVTIRVKAQTAPPSITVTFIDAGTPFDPLKKPEPDITLPLEERQIGGLGILSVKRMMDQTEYAYRDGKNVLTIKKNL